ncbi:hypothetical protein H5410_046925 [Solanum commersonii]|uniref:Uncharacterized protein n=1 Tax=Solanum commersonii TaxID=4109 RepID=A0A9J5XDM9_SOLCO|nr:hypothetical protein H5410_046925 [Solanum commersonii]
MSVLGTDVVVYESHLQTVGGSTGRRRLDGVKKHQKGRKHLKSSEELLIDPTTSKALTSQPSSTTKASDNEHGEEDIDVHARSRMDHEVETVR